MLKLSDETLEHFIIECEALAQTRSQTEIYTEYTQNNKFTLDNILFPKENTQNDMENTKKLLTKIWNKRKNILKTLPTYKTKTKKQRDKREEGKENSD